MRLLTVTDLHQSPEHYRWLAEVVRIHRPDVVACVGDFLHGEPTNQTLLSHHEAAQLLANLPVDHMVFTRGNHEGENWRAFVEAWPSQTRPLIALYGTAEVFGPLVLVGFPCFLGQERPFVQTLPKSGNEVADPTQSGGRKVLPVKLSLWLKPLMQSLGPAGRSIWLMHEPPAGLPIAQPGTFNPIWTDAVENYQPLLTVSGHDHSTPHSRGSWHTKLGKTTCVNSGRGAMELFYCVIDFEFPSQEPCLPCRTTITAMPWKQTIHIENPP